MPGQENLILIVDDNPTNTHDIDSLLTEIGYRLRIVPDDKQAMDFVKDQTPDLILLNIMMPELDGYEVCQMFKNDQNTKHTPIIFISDKIDRKDLVKGYDVGGVDFVTSPFITAELLTKIKTHLAVRKAHEELETCIKERTQKIIKAKEEAEQANRLKSEFLANMSHGLRTSMHAILSFSKFGIDKLEQISEEKKMYYFQKIKTSGDQLMVLLDDLLDLSKLETGEEIYNLESVNSLQIVENIISEMDTNWKEKKLKVNIEDPLISTKIDCDKEKLKQVIRNLLSNAFKFTPENKKITISFKEGKLPFENNPIENEIVSALTISVLDEGVGILNTELNTVFDKFIQSSKTKTGAEGTGLGLSICKEIIKAHNGKIWAEKNPKGGAIFSIMLPYEQMN
ncbi:MAG: hybrid sensor histidine kinase/response regulator [Deltaproteobacteria bacterium]|jgi:signal transduction histidine kinase|nr:hybrid sensor histidine kinase/response regulator [Deltaproteobacteria bacterium]MBT4525566.1 hybrid sensor histidine kinase/response regulator [Deltaproteobacteria bacterium]